MSFDITGAELCRIITENGLEDAIFQSDSSSIFTVDSKNKTVTIINLYTQDSNAWPGVSEWPDNFDELSHDEQESIIDEFDVSPWNKSEEPFERIQTIPLSMFECFVQV